jgi:Zn-dependent peptidase ImmA (M78 family)/DNA-binding XRE family transcriptional regulator
VIRKQTLEFAHINNEVIRWARERKGLAVRSLADYLGVTPEQVSQWESGSGLPPFGRAQDLARTLEIPFGYLFLSTPPTEQPPIPDLRAIDQRRRTLSPEFVDLLNDVMVKHDWFVEYARNNGADRLPFVGRFSAKSPHSEVLADMRAAIAPNELRKEANSWSDYVRLLSLRSEELGALIMRAGVVRGNPRRKISVTEVRGFAISNSFAPLVFVNSRDAQAAQVFTIAHELVHIWIGQSGISNPELNEERTSQAPSHVIETFCNQVAAELLVPANEFERLWTHTAGSNSTRVESLTRRFRVSTPVILRRAHELNRITQVEFYRLWKEHQDKVAALEKRDDAEEESSGGNFYNTFFARNSRKLTQAVVDLERVGKIGRLQAARLLSVRTATIPKLAERLPI